MKDEVTEGNHKEALLRCARPTGDRNETVKSTIAIRTTEDIVGARQQGRSLAEELGYSSSQATLLATAISELARNIILYAGAGELTLTIIKRGEARGIAISASDHGQGIKDVEQALLSGYSTSGSLGLGLPGVRRIMDEFMIDSTPGKGTKVVCTMWR